MSVELNDLPQAGDATPESLASLARGVLDDAQRLLAQQFALLKREIELELRRALRAAICLGVGLVLAGISLFCLLQMAVHALAAYSDLPLWGSYGVVGGFLAIVGAGSLIYGGLRLARLKLFAPPQTTQALKENIEWMTHPTTAK